MTWPKIILVRGLQVPVDSWEEFDELLCRYGGEALVVTGQAVTADGSGSGSSRGASTSSSLSAPDRALLQRFIEGGQRGVLTQHLGPALGAQGKGIRPALDRWARRIGLITEERAEAFGPVKRADGRAYRLNDVNMATARHMLGM